MRLLFVPHLITGNSTLDDTSAGTKLLNKVSVAKNEKGRKYSPVGV
jgi:hypothetical protein